MAARSRAPGSPRSAGRAHAERGTPARGGGHGSLRSRRGLRASRQSARAVPRAASSAASRTRRRARGCARSGASPRWRSCRLRGKDQTLADERVEVRADPVAKLLGREFGDGAPPELLADHRGALQHACSSGSSRSSRAASSALIDGGIGSSPTSRATQRRRRARARRRRGASGRAPRRRAGCPRRRARCGARSRRRARPCREGSRAARAPRPRRAARATRRSPGQPGRSSSRSGRASASTSIGAPRLQPTRYSMRSSSVGSAQCRSSRTSTRGRVRATASSSFRSGPERPPRHARRRRRRASRRARSVDERGLVAPGQELRDPSAHDVPASSAARPARLRTISVTGKNVIPSPYDRQRPCATVAPNDRAATSCASRVLPTPAAPTTVTSRHDCSSSAAR